MTHDEEDMVKGLIQAERIANHFGWVVCGFGYEHEGCSFFAPVRAGQVLRRDDNLSDERVARRVHLDSQTKAALLLWMDWRVVV